MLYKKLDLKAKKPAPQKDVLQNSFENLNHVNISSEAIGGFPLLDLKDDDFLILDDSFSLVSFKYTRPLGSQKMGSADVELLSNTGETITERIYFDFAFSEAERMADAMKPESFYVRPEVSYDDADIPLTPDAYANKYDDIQILDIERHAVSRNNRKQVKIFYVFSEAYHQAAQSKTHEVIFEIPVDISSMMQSQTDSPQVHVLRMSSDADFINGAKILAHDLKHFSIAPKFTKGAAPMTVDASCIIPKPYINLVKIDYIPPKNVDSIEAELLVEYEYEGRVFSDRVAIFFERTIRSEAEEEVNKETKVNFRYVPTSRRVPPISMNVSDFAYIGDLPLKIVKVEYNLNKNDFDSRFVTVALVVRYRTVLVKIAKRLEFQYSRNEYINGNWYSARTENGSIIFASDFIHADNFYQNIDPKTLEFKKTSELLKHASVHPEYPYTAIKNIKLINFDKNSRDLMFKISAIEPDGSRKVLRVFEKHVKMAWSYNEWRLNLLESKDIVVNTTLLPECPSYHLSEDVVSTKEPDFNVLSIQYVYPGDNAKEVEVQVQVAVGHRNKYIPKVVTFERTYEEYKQKLREWELSNTLKHLKPSDLSLKINLAGQAPEEFTAENIKGIPEGVNVKVNYKPPKIGEKVARILIEMSVDKLVVGFEQTLIFAQKRTAK